MIDSVWESRQAHWASETALTAHLVVRNPTGDPDPLLGAAANELRQHFAIEHATLQVESETFAQSCATSASACAIPQT